MKDGDNFLKQLRIKELEKLKIIKRFIIKTLLSWPEIKDFLDEEWLKEHLN
jgi:hypothetical protein